jgi:predicted ribonuclease YlaK
LVSFDCIDGLGYLKNLAFVNSDGTNIIGVRSQLDLLSLALQRTGINSNINIDIEVEALTYSRGRSLPNRYVIIDECQNLTPHQIKTILTRSGSGSRFVLIGDLDQIDVNFLDRESCGLSYVINRFKGQKISAHVHLLHGERSELASIAALIL